MVWWADLLNKKSSSFCVTEAQVIDDYRILGITKHPEVSTEVLLVLWDTSGPRPRQSVFGTPSNKLVPEQLISSAPVERGIGLHRADPNQRIVGVVCQGLYGDVRHDSDYMVVVSVADLCAHASTQGAGEQKIRWEKWRSSATIVKVNLAITMVARISASRFFATVKVSHTEFATLFRIYDFSPGARGRRHPNTPPVQDYILNAGRVMKQAGTASWDFSEDNLLMFNVSAGLPNP